MDQNQNSQPRHDVDTYDGQLLSVAPAMLEGKPVAIMTFRLNPEKSFQSHNVAIPVEQAIRLHKDLGFLIENSDIFKGVIAEMEPEEGQEPQRTIKRRTRKKKG